MAFRYNPLTGNFDIVTDLGQETDDISELQNQLQDLINSIGVAEGIASLDESGKVPSSQLPSYVDDVIEVSDFSSLPLIGETGKIYVTLDTNLTYRWSGSVYIEIARSQVLSVNGKTGEVELSKLDIGLSEVDNTSDLNKPVSTETQAALNLKYDVSNPAGYVTESQLQNGEIPFPRYNFEVIEITEQNLLDKYVTLNNTPFFPSLVCLDMVGGIRQVNGVDFQVIENKIEWAGLGLDGFIDNEDTLLVQY
jgi:hypothetical protein